VEVAARRERVEADEVAAVSERSGGANSGVRTVAVEPAGRNFASRGLWEGEIEEREEDQERNARGRRDKGGGGPSIERGDGTRVEQPRRRMKDAIVRGNLSVGVRKNRCTRAQDINPGPLDQMRKGPWIE
jgi:hypothetical protein